MRSWISYAKDIFNNDLTIAFGPVGIKGNKEQIEDACDKLIAAMRALLDWEISISSVVPDSVWTGVFKKLQNSTLYFINDVETFFIDFRKLLKTPNIKGQHTLTCKINFPKNMVGIQKDINPTTIQKISSEAIRQSSFS